MKRRGDLDHVFQLQIIFHEADIVVSEVGLGSESAFHGLETPFSRLTRVS